MLFWLIVWVLIVIVFVLAPFCSNTEARRNWIARLSSWFSKLISLGRNTPPNSNLATSNQDERFHYVLSSTQEEEIRECFLKDKLKNYTISIKEGDIKGTELCEDLEKGSVDTNADAAEKSTTTDDDKADLAPKDNDNDNDDSKSVTQESDEKQESPDDDCTVDFYVDEIEAAGFLLIPAGGDQCDDHSSVREVSNGCSVCLCPFEAEQQITWSSNQECNHAFHHSCILDWFKASGRRHCRRRQRQEELNGVLNYANNPLLKIVNFPMQCPCCRQVFIAPKVAKPELSTRSIVASAAVSATSSSSLDSSASEAGEVSPLELSTTEVPEGTADVNTAAASTPVLTGAEENV